MAYVAIGRIKQALDATHRYHPFFGTTLLSMLQSGVTILKSIQWGSSEENQLLGKYYTPPGAPARKPYFVPFGRAEKAHGYWRNAKYSAGSLQSARTREAFANGLFHPNLREWAFTQNYLDVFEAMLPRKRGIHQRIPVLSLSAWLFRDRDLSSNLDEVVALFRSEFKIESDQVFDRLFDGSVEEQADAFFANERADEDELRLLIGGVPRGPALARRSEADLLDSVERYLVEDARLDLPPGFVRNFYYSLKTQRFVIVAGRPGTGKSTFARSYADALSKFFGGTVTTIVVPIGQEQGESETIGYAKISGGLEPTELTRELFLADRERDIFVVVLDEMNLSPVDYYLARLLPAIESDARLELPGMDERFELPPDSYFVGTINSFVEDNTRLALSAPIKRRANVIEMPNILDEIVRGANRDRFERFCRMLLEQTEAKIAFRARRDSASVLDQFRAADLRLALGSGGRALEGGLIDLLWEITTICARDPLTSMTAGVLQDILDFVAMSPGLPVAAALDRQIAQKLVPQLNGPVGVAKAIRDLLLGRAAGESLYPLGIAALDALLATVDSGTDLVFYKY